MSSRSQPAVSENEGAWQRVLTHGRGRPGEADVERFVTECWPTVCERLTWFAARHRVDPEDVMQETLARALERIDQFTSTDAMLAWCIGTGRLVCYELARQRRRLQPHSDLTHLVEAVLRPTPDASEQVEAIYHRADVRRRVRAALAGLTDRDRGILCSREIEDMSYAAIGARYGMSESAVTSALFRARSHVRRLLQASGTVAIAPLAGAYHLASAVRDGWLRHRAVRLAAPTSATGTTGQVAFIGLVAVSVTVGPLAGFPLTPIRPAQATPAAAPTPTHRSGGAQPTPTSTRPAAAIPPPAPPRRPRLRPTASPTAPRGLAGRRLCLAAPDDPLCLPPAETPPPEHVERCWVRGPEAVGDKPVEQDAVPLAEHVPDNGHVECEKDGNPDYKVSPSPPPAR